MASLNSMYQAYVINCRISSYKANFYLLNFQKRTYSPSSFTWENCYNCISEIFFSTTAHNCIVTRNRATTFRRHNCPLTKRFRLHPNFLSVQVQQVRLYSSKNGKENAVPEISIDNMYPVQEEIHSMSYKKVMRNVPQSIVLLTSAMFQTDTNSWLKRGVTCSSLLSVSLKPPILSFCLNRPSRMHDLLLQSQQFAINILGKHQAKLVDLFSSPAQDGVDQFLGIPHHVSKEGLPVLFDTPVLLCKTHCAHNVGDHSVWYGMVTGTLHENMVIEPVLHYYGSYHDIGERIPTVPRCVFTQGPVISNLKIAWHCIKSHGLEGSLYCMKEMFQKRFQSKEKDWHETIAMFYLKKVSIALKAEQNSEQTFEEFLQKNNTLVNLNDHLLHHYSVKLISSPEAKEKYVPPDQKPFNSLH